MTYHGVFETDDGVPWWVDVKLKCRTGLAISPSVEGMGCKRLLVYLQEEQEQLSPQLQLEEAPEQPQSPFILMVVGLGDEKMGGKVLVGLKIGAWKREM